MARGRRGPVNCGAPLVLMHVTAVACLVMCVMPPLLSPAYIFVLPVFDDGSLDPMSRIWVTFLADLWLVLILTILYAAWAVLVWRGLVKPDTGCGMELACYGLHARHVGLWQSLSAFERLVYTRPLLYLGSAACLIGVAITVTQGIRDEVRRRARPQTDVSAFD